MRAEKDSRDKYEVKNNYSILFCFLRVFLWAVAALLFFNSFLFLFTFEYFFVCGVLFRALLINPSSVARFKCYLH